jgi:hypothetical protein
MGRADLEAIASTAGRYYKPFDRRRTRGEGKWRHIDNPKEPLKRIQKRINRRILSTVPLPPAMLGAVQGMSIRDNGLLHVRQPVVVTLDLRDCFPRTSHHDVATVLKRNFGCSEEITSLLTRLTTFQHRVPQGAPTSATLVNLSLLPLYDDIQELAERKGLRFSLWVDDITISGPAADDAIEPVIQLVQRHGHAVRQSKVHVMRSGNSQAVTGVVVNRKVGKARDYRAEIRRQIIDLADRPNPPAHEIQSVRSRIAHVRHLCPVQGDALQRLADKVLPAEGVGGTKPRSDEIRPCRCAKKHRHRHIADRQAA